MPPLCLHSPAMLQLQQHAHRFFRMYVSSSDDTAKREVDDRAVGTILFTPIRPEFRGPVRFKWIAWFGPFLNDLVCLQVACFLASTNSSNRKRFYEVCVCACLLRTQVRSAVSDFR